MISMAGVGCEVNVLFLRMHSGFEKCSGTLVTVKKCVKPKSVFNRITINTVLEMKSLFYMVNYTCATTPA